MLPRFPRFRKLALADKSIMESFVGTDTYYSDYNFVSLWSFNTNNEIKLSSLNDNLVLRFSDYLTGESFYTFFGYNRVRETILILLEHARIVGITPTLKLIPESCVVSTDFSTVPLYAEEDRDNFDYVLSLAGVANLQGGAYCTPRKMVNRFKRKYPNSLVSSLDLTSNDILQEIYALSVTWEKQNPQTASQLETERCAMQRCLDLSADFDALSVGIYVDDLLVAFALDELGNPPYVMGHFRRADINYMGVFQYLEHCVAQAALELGYTYINYEQDLGISGLRSAKRAWRPVKFLKKYTIAAKVT